MALPTLGLSFGEDRTYDVRISDPLGAAFVRSRINEVVDRAFRITWPRLRNAQLVALRADFDAAKGGAGQVTVIHPLDGAIVCRFEDDELRVRRRSNAPIFDVSITASKEQPGTSVG